MKSLCINVEEKVGGSVGRFYNGLFTGMCALCALSGRQDISGGV